MSGTFSIRIAAVGKYAPKLELIYPTMQVLISCREMQRKVRTMKEKSVIGAALTVAALSLPAGVATASPVASGDAAVTYTATTNPTSTIISTDAGSLVDEDGVFKIKAVDGTVLAGTELSFRVDDFVFPIAAEIRDRSATLTP
ncbi:hypothetical protein ACWDTH_35605, partial [Nocardia xishanensis]